jgi:hypothetical protein
MSTNTATASASLRFARRRDRPYFIGGSPERIYCQESSVVYKRIELTFTLAGDFVGPSKQATASQEVEPNDPTCSDESVVWFEDSSLRRYLTGQTVWSARPAYQSASRQAPRQCTVVEPDMNRSSVPLLETGATA